MSSRTSKVRRAVLCLMLAASMLALAGVAHGARSTSAAAPGPLAGESVKLWVFFTDKALVRGGELSAIEAFRGELTERALLRRAKVGMEVNANDLPVAGEYVDAVAAIGVEIVTKSRWLNAVSVFADDGQASAIAELPFVRDVRPVARGVKELPEVTEAASDRSGGRNSRLDYGDSAGQIEQIQIDQLHDEGFDGTGVLIAMLDTGFDTDHEAYRHLDLVAERDFINDDSETANEEGDPDGQDSHGTATLSCVGAAYPGELYGGSYNASFVLCKTEQVDDEIEIEEDYWVEAIEWADSLGVEVASSSLGYFYWYEYADMDGNTAVTTVAADMAVARGIVVVNSMGNEGNSEWTYMIAPADGDSVLSIGAVNIEDERTGFSSVGPTYDGRIKPDVMALGSSVYVATTADTNSYGHAGGTSFSCPMTAGVVGLLLQGHPEWTPIDVIDALHSTASQSDAPDTLMGWGIVRAYDAMYYIPQGIDEGEVEASRLVWSAPNPFGPMTSIRYQVPNASQVRVEVYDVAGRLVRTLYDGRRPSGTFAAEWDGHDATGARAASGVYFCRATIGESSSSVKMSLVR